MFDSIRLPSPIGEILAVARGRALVALVFADHWPKELERLNRRYAGTPFSTTVARDAWRHPGPDAAADSVKSLARVWRSYLDGRVDALDRLPVDVEGTDFQMRVWKALRTIPAGETISYSELAVRARAEGAVRAAGNANGRNPISLAIPCHRVIHADGSIGGYGGGVHRKRWLLDHERKHAGRTATPTERLAFTITAHA